MQIKNYLKVQFIYMLKKNERKKEKKADKIDILQKRVVSQHFQKQRKDLEF